MSKYKEQKKKQIYQYINNTIEHYKDKHEADYDWYVRQTFKSILYSYRGSRIIIDEDVIRMMISSFPDNYYNSIEMILSYFSAHYYLTTNLIYEFEKYFKNIRNYITFYGNDTMRYTQHNIQLLMKMNII